MGDFSVRCAFSRLPIPAWTPVVVIPCGVLRGTARDESGRFRYPLALPSLGEMGCYGHCTGDAPPDKSELQGGEYLYVLPDLYKAAGKIWLKHIDMFPDEPTFSSWLKAQRAEAQLVRKLGDEHENWRILRSLRSSRSGVWWYILRDMSLFNPDREPCITSQFDALIDRDEEPKPEEVEAWHDFLCATAAVCVIGHDHWHGSRNYPFHQYPDLKVEIDWHTAILEEAKRLNRIEVAKKADAEEDDKELSDSALVP